MHGREARFPMEAEKSKPVVNPDIDTTIEHLRKMKEEIYPVAKQSIDQSQEWQKQQYRRRKGVRVKPESGRFGASTEHGEKDQEGPQDGGHMVGTIQDNRNHPT